MKKPHILHLIDNQKFTDFVTQSSNDNPITTQKSICHSFLMFGGTPKTYNLENVTAYTTHDFEEYKERISNSNADALVIHCLSQEKLFALATVKRLAFKKIAWCFWGVDFYNPYITDMEIYTPMTRKVLPKKNLKQLLLPFFHFFKFKTNYHLAYKKILPKIDYISPIVDTELSLANNKDLNAKHLQFAYGNLDSLIGELVNSDFPNLPENNIFIGNSDTYESNHLDVLNALSNLNLTLSERKIIIPLNYKANDLYKDQVIDFGQKHFGKNLLPLVDFIPLNEYIKYISNSSHAVFGHKRQQGLGNIVALLYLGVKLFLYKDNPIYTYLKNNGCHIFSIENDLTEKQLNQSLSLDEKIENRAIMSSLFSKKTIEDRYYTFFKTIIDNL